MNEILFRGKRVDNGEWVEGNLLKIEHANNSAFYIIPFITNGRITQDKLMLNFISPCYEIIPETVGQYTGMSDKNKARIFKGDILKVIEVTGDKLEEYVTDVTWDACAFMVKSNVDYYDTFLGAWEAWSDTSLNMYPLIELEVIGNIYDNPELLEDEK